MPRACTQAARARAIAVGAIELQAAWEASFRGIARAAHGQVNDAKA